MDLVWETRTSSLAPSTRCRSEQPWTLCWATRSQTLYSRWLAQADQPCPSLPDPVWRCRSRGQAQDDQHGTPQLPDLNSQEQRPSTLDSHPKNSGVEKVEYPVVNYFHSSFHLSAVFGTVCATGPNIAVIILPAKAREYVSTGVGLCLCVSVCDHDN